MFFRVAAASNFNKLIVKYEDMIYYIKRLFVHNCNLWSFHKKSMQWMETIVEDGPPLGRPDYFLICNSWKYTVETSSFLLCLLECMQNPISEFHLMLVLKMTNIKCNIFNGAFSVGGHFSGKMKSGGGGIFFGKKKTGVF